MLILYTATALFFLIVIALVAYFLGYRARVALRMHQRVLDASIKYYNKHIERFDSFEELHELPDVDVLTYSLKPLRIEYWLSEKSYKRLKPYFDDG